MSEFLIYQTEGGKTQISVVLENETLWLSQKQLSELFGKAKGTISEHIKHIFEDGELLPAATVRLFRTVQTEGSRTVEREVEHYNLDMVLALGYRVRSQAGVRFRQWATAQLKEFIVKGFLLDDERLKNPGQGRDYFDELTSRLQDIRTSERRFYQKITDIYATAIDYDVTAQATQRFFATVQNKLHWAVHGHTASELVSLRADATQPHVGATNWPGQAKGLPIRMADVSVAKNFLTAGELEALNRIVMAYIEVAELQALAREPMTMNDWRAQLDDFLRLTRKDILTHAGKVSAVAAKAKAEAAFVQYQQQAALQPSAAERDFEKAIAAPVKQLGQAMKNALKKDNKSNKKMKTGKQP